MVNRKVLLNKSVCFSHMRFKREQSHKQLIMDWIMRMTITICKLTFNKVLLNNKRGENLHHNWFWTTLNTMMEKILMLNLIPTINSCKRIMGYLTKRNKMTLTWIMTTNYMFLISLKDKKCRSTQEIMIINRITRIFSLRLIIKVASLLNLSQINHFKVDQWLAHRVKLKY